MALGGIIACNDLIEFVINAWEFQLNSASTLHLYQTVVALTPATIASDLTESTFTGYAAKNLAGLYGTPAQVIDGEWQTIIPSQTFTCTAGAAQTVYGYWIDDGSQMYWVEAFSTPLLMVAGGSFGLQLNLQEWALAILP
jgi:hypothetical protein